MLYVLCTNASRTDMLYLLFELNVKYFPSSSIFEKKMLTKMYIDTRPFSVGLSCILSHVPDATACSTLLCVCIIHAVADHYVQMVGMGGSEIRQ